MSDRQRKRAAPAEARRRRELAKIHLGAKALCWDDTTYRAILQRLTGARSAKDLDARQRSKVLDYMKEQGFKPIASGRLRGAVGKIVDRLRPAPDDPVDAIRAGLDVPAMVVKSGRAAVGESGQIVFIRALWRWLGEHGALKESEQNWQAALRLFVHNQTGIANVAWLTPADASQVIEALKSWVRRHHAKRQGQGERRVGR